MLRTVVASMLLALAGAAAAVAGHGAASYENQLKIEQKAERRKSGGTGVPSAPQPADDRAASKSGDPDRSFAATLRQSLQEDITAAQRQIDRGSDPGLEKLAESILESRRREIERLDAWLSENSRRD
ncbi:MAG TPA: DUF305 domain-containing protein [Candidatus Binatia bacterium]|nr:DUF305 domain-containing protein [Candidatus Binatia bacterium]